MFGKKKKKKDEEQGLARCEEQKLTPEQLEQIMAHPAIQELSARLDAVKQMLGTLPEAVGRAVAEALNGPPEKSWHPPVPVASEFGKGGPIEITKDGITAGGKTYPTRKPGEGADEQPGPRKP